MGRRLDRTMDRNLQHADRRAALHLHLQCGRRKAHRHGEERPRTTDITNGTIKGDQISFDESLDFNGQTIAIKYTGTVSGDSIKLHRKVGDFAEEDLVANRVK